jgi:curved DNA-binding protein CbpA
VSGPDPDRGVSWYDVLGVLPGASAAKIQRIYDAKVSLLQPELISGAPSNVVKAASRARAILDEARRVLGDPVSRERYDEAAGFRRSGEGLAGPRTSLPIPGSARPTSVTAAAATSWNWWAA